MFISLVGVLCFTAEEAYTSRHGDGAATSALQTFHDIPAEVENEQLEENGRQFKDSI